MATKKEIEASIDTLRESLKSDDELIVFFAGHGDSWPYETPGIKQVREAGYIIPQDAEVSDHESSHHTNWHLSQYIGLRALLEDLDALPARHVLVILDSCDSGIAIDDISKRAPRGNGLAARGDGPTRWVISSADQGESADDGTLDEGHSLFAGWLLKGLRDGEADLNRRRAVSGQELAVFLHAQVRKASGLIQNPQFTQFGSGSGGDWDIPLRMNPILIGDPARDLTRSLPPRIRPQDDWDDEDEFVPESPGNRLIISSYECAGAQALECVTLGGRYEMGLLGEQDPPMAEALYRKACRNGEKLGCLALGKMLMLGKDGKPDLPRARVVFLHACDLGTPGGCYLAGAMFLEGEGGGRSDERGADLLQRGCDRGDGGSCYVLALLYREGRGRPTNAARYRELMKKGCALRDEDACNAISKMDK